MRIFPKPEQDYLISFAYHSIRLEKVPISQKDIDETLNQTQVNTHLEGHLKAVNLVLELAGNELLLPKTPKPNEDITWMKRIHKNLFESLLQESHMMMNQDMIYAIGSPGSWRTTSIKDCPSPFEVPQLLQELIEDLANFHNNFRAKIETPYGLSYDDLQILSEKAYETNLKICYIQPFQFGSNRVARFTENLLRLNWGLPWKIIKHEPSPKQCYLDDIKDMIKKSTAQLN